MKKHAVYILLISFFGGSYIQAKPHNPQEKAQKMREELELSDEQFQELQIIFEEKNQMIFERIQDLKEEIYIIRTELSHDFPDIKIIQSSLKEKAKIIGDIEYIAIIRDLDMKALLNEKQWQDFSKQHFSNSSSPSKESSSDLHNSQELANYLANIKSLVKKINQDIDLSSEQLEKMEELLKESAQELYTTRKKLLPIIFNIRDELLKDPPNEDQIFDYLEKKAEITSKMELISISRDLALKEILTNQQWNYLKEGMLEKMTFSNAPFLHGPFQQKRKERR